MSAQSWRGFFSGIGQEAVRTGLDFAVADASRDNHLGIPEGNMFAGVPALTPQAQLPSHSASGIPFSFKLPNGKLNFPIVALAGLGALLFAKVVTK